jgi:hypothetical protein
MKVVHVTIAAVLASIPMTSVFAQGRAGAGGGARGGAVGSAPITARAVTAGAPAATTAAPASGAGAAIGTPGTGTPVGPINPGGITATPPQAVGRTFDRSTIGGGPADTVVNPVAAQPTFRFPPESTLRQPIVTNLSVNRFDSGLPPVSAAGNAPVTAGNTVGSGSSIISTGIRPVEPVAINLPPGARITTNAVGAQEIGFPPVNVPITATNSVGSSPGVQSSTVRVAPVAPRPTNVRR